MDKHEKMTKILLQMVKKLTMYDNFSPHFMGFSTKLAHDEQNFVDNMLSLNSHRTKNLLIAKKSSQI